MDFRLPSRSAFLLYALVLPCFLVLGSRGPAQNFYLPTPYPTVTITPTATPAAISIGSPFPDINGVLLNPVEKTDIQKKEELKRRKYLNPLDYEESWMRLSDLNNRSILVYFWSSTSPRSIEEAPALLDLHATFNSRGLEILGISLDTDRAAAERFIHDWSIPWSVLWDPDGWNSAHALQVHVHSLPCNFLLDGTRVLRARDIRAEALGPWVTELLATAPSDPSSPVIQIEPTHPEPGSEYRVEYFPLRVSLKNAPEMSIVSEPDLPSLTWPTYPMERRTEGTTDGNGAGKVVWSAQIPFPADQARDRLFVGPGLRGLPPAKVRESLDAVRITVESATLQRIGEARRLAEETESKGDWTEASRRWIALLQIRPADPLNYARAVMGALRAATKDPKAGNPVQLVQQLPSLPLPVDRASAERAVREILQPGEDDPALDPWLARGASTLLFTVANRTTETLTNSYIDTFAWALYKAGYPDRALAVQQRISHSLLLQDPALGLREVLYFIKAGDPDAAKRLYRDLEATSRPMMEMLPELESMRRLVFQAMPEEELLTGELTTSDTLALVADPAAADAATTASLSPALEQAGPEDETGAIDTRTTEPLVSESSVPDATPPAEAITAAQLLAAVTPTPLYRYTVPPLSRPTPAPAPPLGLFEGGIPVPYEDLSHFEDEEATTATLQESTPTPEGTPASPTPAPPPPADR